MRRIVITASVNYVDGEFSMKDLGLEEDATEEEIEQTISDMVNEHLDWGWEEK